MLYRVLVVDDEPRHRMGLVKMIKGLKPEYTVLEARNGQEALELSSVNDLDIIITDINMPIMDGLQLMENLGPKLKDIKIIILSAFGYFNYAQKALSLGASDYLLKPVDEEKINEMLNRLENQLYSESIEKQEKDSLKKQLDNTLPAYLELQLNKLIRGNLGEQEIKEIENIFPYKGEGAVIITEIMNFMEIGEDYNTEEINEIRLNIKYWIKKAFNSVSHSISFYLHCDKTILVTLLSSDGELSIGQSANSFLFDDFIQNLQISYGFNATIGLSETYRDIFYNIREAFNQAISALEYKFFMNQEKVITFSDSIKNFSKIIPITYKEQEAISEAISKLDREKSLKLIDFILENMTAYGYPPVKLLKETVIHMLMDVVKNMYKLLGEDAYNILVGYIPSVINICNYFVELKETVKTIILSIIDDICIYKDKRGDVIFNKYIDYIQENLSQDISLDSMSQEFHFNSSYFSYLFKLKTGVNFSQYLIEMRLREAKKLLENTKKKVYEISKNVGYKDPKYFIRAFKKEFGLTPDEYRRSI